MSDERVCRLSHSILSRRIAKSKKNREEPPVLAGNLPGNIGDKDVDYLTHYVSGLDPTRSAGTSRRERKAVEGRSKEAGGKKKAPERSNSQPESSCSEEKVVTKMPKGRSTSPLDRPSSPSHAASVASYAPDELILRSDEFSDEEKGYHTDQDSGFQLMIGKKRYNRHNRASRLPGVNSSSSRQANARVPTAATLSPTASSPASLSAAASFSVSGASASGSTNLHSRGYDSEKEFYADNFSSRQATVRRRKTASSMPHSERNSPENSDVDSSLSLPIVHRLPPRPPVSEEDHSGRISYAQIARSASTAAARPTPATSRSAAAIDAGAGAGVKSRQSAPKPPASHVQSSVASESASSVDNPAAEAREPEASGTSGVACDSGTRVSLNESEISACDAAIGVTVSSGGSSLPPPSSTASSGAPNAAADNRQQIRKHNSIPEASFKSMIATKTLNRSLDSARPPLEMPAVIMCTDGAGPSSAKCANGSEAPTAVTFGFFDDLTDDDERSDAALPSSLPTSPIVSETEVHASTDQTPAPLAPSKQSVTSPPHEAPVPVAPAKNSPARLPTSSTRVADADIETFNYSEILAYIRKGKGIEV